VSRGLDVSNADDFKQLLKLAVLEESGDQIIYMKKFGKSAVLGANVQESIWTVGGDRTVLFTEQTISVVSTSDEDAVDGDGACTIVLQGLDGNYNIISERLEINGTTPVTAANKYMRLERMLVVETLGAGDTNVGTITATETGGSTVQAQIEADRGQTQMAMFTIPAGYTGLVTYSLISCYRASGSGTKRGEIDIHSYNDEGVHYKLYTYGMSNDGTSTLSANFDLPFLVPEKNEVHLNFTAETTATLASATVDILMVKGIWNDNDNTFV
jgi:hypothetical protein